MAAVPVDGSTELVIGNLVYDKLAEVRLTDVPIRVLLRTFAAFFLIRYICANLRRLSFAPLHRTHRFHPQRFAALVATF
jgi:hypothetical protein